MERRLQQMQDRLDKEIRAREKAEKRLREGSFSQSLAKALFGRQTPPENGENSPEEE